MSTKNKEVIKRNPDRPLRDKVANLTGYYPVFRYVGSPFGEESGNTVIAAIIPGYIGITVLSYKDKGKGTNPKYRSRELATQRLLECIENTSIDDILNIPIGALRTKVHYPKARSSKLTNCLKSGIKEIIGDYVLWLYRREENNNKTKHPNKPENI